jgi:hypothetical protein
MARWLAATVLLLGAGRAAALEPRFDHRDQQGPFAAILLARDTVSPGGGVTETHLGPALHVGWSLEVSGEGDELLAGAQVPLGGFSDADRTRVLAALDLRYRGYFGSEELKTFFELGLWGTVASRWTAGPVAGLGLQVDLSRAAGLFATATFATSFGEARVASLQAGVGVQVRFE